MSRLKRANELFPNAPKFTTCRICKATFQNTLALGSGIVTVVCGDCRGELCNRTKRATRNKKRPAPVGNGGKGTNLLIPPKSAGIKPALSGVIVAKSILPDSIVGWVA
jgi:hypothetical protein